MTRVFTACGGRSAAGRFQGAKSGGRLSRNLALALAGGLLLSASPMTAQAQVVTYGATGGEGGVTGGAGGNAGQPGSTGAPGTSGTGGAGGSAGSPGGSGGDGTGDGSGGGGGGGSSNTFTGDILAPMDGGDGGDGGNGDGGGGGGAGGDGAVNMDASPDISVSANVTGGNGGNGGDSSGSTSFDGAGGGGGGGIVLTNKGAITVQTSANVDGGDGGSYSLANYGGGGGGAGIIMVDGGTLTNSGDIQGGTGGAGANGGAGLLIGGIGDVTNSGRITGGAGLSLGDGGAAIDLGSGGSVTNSGFIIGGTSDGLTGTQWGRAGGEGSGGASGSDPNASQSGMSGAGIVGANVSIVNSGTIEGGKIGGTVTANAITFTGGVNRLELQAGSTIVGVVDATASSSANFVLGGATNSSFDVSTLGTQYLGFDTLEKTGTSIWTLTGTTTAVTPWLISQGTIRAGVTGALGSGAVTIQSGASLQFINSASAGNLAITNTAGGIGFRNMASAGAATINITSGSINFYDTASAQDATIVTNGGGVAFNGSSTAGNAMITVGGGGPVDFYGSTTAGSATITNNPGGVTRFHDNTTADNATIINNAGGSVTIAALAAGGIGIGSLLGDGDVQLGAKTLTLGGLGKNDTIGGVISGTGGLTKIGTGTLTLTGDSVGFTGNTIVHGGTLSVNGTLGGVVDVASGGMLGGSGTVGMTTVGTGGTIAPGNSIGVLTVNGNYTQKAGSTYEAEIDPAGNADLINVTGTATIEGGTVFALKAPGGYGLGTRYTLLSAAGGVTGVYDTLDQNAPFVDLKLVYDPGNVYLDVIRNTASFCAVAVTRNQCATATGVESTGRGNPAFAVIAGLPTDAAARDAFDQLSGEIHASGKGALLEDSRFAREASLARARAGVGGDAASPVPVMAYWPTDLALATASSESLAAWGEAYGAWSQVDGDGNAAGLDHFSGGLLTGIDGMAGNWRLGLLAGFGRSSFNADDRASSGSSNNYHIGLYGGTQWGKIGLRAGAAYSWHDIETTREVSVGGLADTLSADYGASTAQVFGELGYKIERGGFAFEPFAGLAYVNLNTADFTEQGGPTALTSAGSNTGAAFATLGVRASTSFTLGTVNATARGLLGWRHTFGDFTPTASNAFAGGDAFAIAGLPIAEDAAVIEAGLDLDLMQSATLGLSYSGQIADNAHEHGLEAAFSVRF